MNILRDEDFYYQYEQKGGTIEIPKEVFWELYYDSKEEIERLNNIINELENYFNKIKDTSTLEERIMAKFVLKYIDELKGIKPYDELDEILELERDNLELKGEDKE